MKKLSVIVPCYNEEESVPLFYKEIVKISNEMKVDFEYIFVNDGSKDKTLDILKDLAKNDKRVKYISFSKNYGKEAAMLAGLKKSVGDYVTIMDADLQHPPRLLPKMLDALENEGYDVANARRSDRKGENALRNFLSRTYYKIVNKMSDVEMVSNASDYRLMTRQVVDSLLSLKEYNRYLKGLYSFVGYKIKWIEVENEKRVAGNTTWSFKSLFKYAVDGIVGFTTKPLLLAFVFSILFLICSFVLFLILLIENWIPGTTPNTYIIIGWMLSLVTGINLLCLGIIGEYLAKTYTEVKNRPNYIIKEEN